MLNNFGANTIPTQTRNSSEASDSLLGLIQNTIEDSKGQNPVVINLNGKSTIADFMVIATGTSQRHVSSIANAIERKLSEQGLSCKIEGRSMADWVLIDAGDIVVHVFRQEVREFYALEKMWGFDVPLQATSSATSHASL